MKRILLAVVLVVATGCDALAPKQSAPNVFPFVTPILRGDTVRFFSCANIFDCEPPNIGLVPSRWTIPDSSIAALIHTSPATVVPSATSVLVRGIAAGQTIMSATHPDGGRAWNTTVIVGDSSDITRMDVSGFYADSMRVTQQTLVTVMLWDAKGRWYQAGPTAWSVSDTSVLKVAQQPPSILSRFSLHVEALKPGNVSVVITFLGLTETKNLRVVP